MTPVIFRKFSRKKKIPFHFSTIKYNVPRGEKNTNKNQSKYARQIEKFIMQFRGKNHNKVSHEI